MRNFLIAGLAAAAALAAGSANASIFSYSTDFSSGVGAEWSISANVNSADPGILGQLGDGPASTTLSRTSSGASAALGGTLTFDFLGFRTLDGVNCCTDLLYLNINGADVFIASFGMGGGGPDFTYLNANGATYTGSGNLRTVTVPFTAVAGLNTFSFNEPFLQSFADEAFGLDNVSFSAEVASATHGPGVPEPGSWALMILGFAGAGAALRSHRKSGALTA